MIGGDRISSLGLELLGIIQRFCYFLTLFNAWVNRFIGVGRVTATNFGPYPPDEACRALNLLQSKAFGLSIWLLRSDCSWTVFLPSGRPRDIEIGYI